MTKNIVIVGASSGIGKATAKLLSENGNNIIALNRSEPEYCTTYIPWDVTQDLPDLSALPAQIHGLVYFPGTINLKPFNRLKQEDFMYDITINFLGAVKVLQALFNNLKSGNASVVLFSTVAVGTGMPFHSSIASAKGAIEGLARSLAAELAPAVRVNAIAPSLTHTPLADRLLNTPEKITASAARHPLNKVGNPAHIAKLVSFLLSEDAEFITGQIIKADGGIGSLKI
jgi:3-oxoacyl-[acyl-carrier protein] reductase